MLDQHRRCVNVIQMFRVDWENQVIYIFIHLEVVSRCHVCDFQVCENYSYLFNLTPNFVKS